MLKISIGKRLLRIKNLYIGDFGNNENKREDLCIYKIAKTLF
jgi:hypothetical protein